ncbi:hypothetical protein ACFVTT_25425 [Streptomyces niveus]|uniref:hypothetical protein n=1 Tax=Streptomyces niveus TaxID=193462 RepID=UPI003433446A
MTADLARTHQFGFAVYLDREIGDEHGPSLASVAAWEALTALYEITRRDADADIDRYFDCALRASTRSSGQHINTPAAAIA